MCREGGGVALSWACQYGIGSLKFWSRVLFSIPLYWRMASSTLKGAAGGSNPSLPILPLSHPPHGIMRDHAFTILTHSTHTPAHMEFRTSVCAAEAGVSPGPDIPISLPGAGEPERLRDATPANNAHNGELKGEMCDVGASPRKRAEGPGLCRDRRSGGWGPGLRKGLGSAATHRTRSAA